MPALRAGMAPGAAAGTVRPTRSIMSEVFQNVLVADMSMFIGSIDRMNDGRGGREGCVAQHGGAWGGRATQRGRSMQRVYFDCHVYDLLIEPSNQAIREKVLEAVRRGALEIYGSVVNLEELGGLAGKDTSKYRKLIDCFWDYVRSNVLLDRAFLLQAETQKSDRLSMSEACFEKALVKSRIRPASYDQERMRDIADEFAEKKRCEAASMKTTFRELQEKVETAWEQMRSAEQYDSAEYKRWLKTVSTREIQTWLDNQRGREGAPRVHWWCSPCAAAINAWMYARVKRNLRDGRQYRPSDNPDMDHVIFATQVGALVTNDADLAMTIAMIETPLATVQTSDEFLDGLLTAT